MIKQFVPVLANSSAFEKFVGLLEHTSEEPTNLLRVLTYHRVDKPNTFPWLDPGLISATPEVFEMQMKYLAANYETVSVLDVIKAFEMEGRNVLPPRAVLVTFDDGYCDFKEHAWPILKQHQIPATLFVPTAFPNHPERSFWWDRLFHALHSTSVSEFTSPLGRLSISTPAQRHQAYKLLKNHFKKVRHDLTIADVDQICRELDVPSQGNIVLSWDSLRQLVDEGLTLGAHTRNHPIMNCISLEELAVEVTGSLQDLTHQMGSSPLTFAYPSGIHNGAAVSIVELAGFQLAFTTQRGINEIDRADRFRLKRINVGARTTLPLLRAQLLTWSTPVYAWSNKFFD